MNTVLIVLETPWTDPKGVQHKPGLVEIEERYVQRNRVHGFRFRYPTETEVAKFKSRSEKNEAAKTQELHPVVTGQPLTQHKNQLIDGGIPNV